MLNEVPVEYYSPLDSEGVRQDIASRPELAGGSVDYIAPKEYMVSPSIWPWKGSKSFFQARLSCMILISICGQIYRGNHVSNL